MGLTFRHLPVVAPSGKRPPVAQLAHGLDRVLFNPGVQVFRDPRTNVYNFDERLRHLQHPDEYDFSRLPAYVTASQDKDLAALAETHACKFFGSTSTLTSSLAQIWYAVSKQKEINPRRLTMPYQNSIMTHAVSAVKPAAIILRYDSKRKTYGVDNDKAEDPPGQQPILRDLGKVMEKMLTTTVEDLKRFRKDSPPEAVSQEERNAREAHNYTRGRSLIMRSQLDGYDARLPGTGIFDIKTRATASVRFDLENWEEGGHYMVDRLTGLDNTFERERYDMMRSAWLKFGLQCRIGGMDGIFCAYHSTRYIHGFEYLPVETMDDAIFGSKAIGDQNFGISVGVLERIFEAAVKQYPEETLSIYMQAVRKSVSMLGQLAVVVRPVRDNVAPGDIPVTELRLVFENEVDGVRARAGALDFGSNPDPTWKVRTTIYRNPKSEAEATLAKGQYQRVRDELLSFGSIGTAILEGKTSEEMQQLFSKRWYAEVNKPNGEFSSFAYRQATPEEALALAQQDPSSNASPAEKAHPIKLNYPLPLVKAEPPVMRFRRPTESIALLRQLSQQGKAEEKQRLETYAGQFVQYSVQPADVLPVARVETFNAPPPPATFTRPPAPPPH